MGPRLISSRLSLALGLALLAPAAAAAPPTTPRGAVVQYARTFLAPTGADSGSCIATAPCRSLQFALNLTLPGGEIYVQASGYYGSATIAAAVSIVSEGAALGGAGLTISAGANDDIYLRGVDLDGAGVTPVGVDFRSGRSLTITKSVVRNFTGNGIVANAGAVFISEVSVTANGNNGIAVAGSSTAIVSKVTATLNATGIFSSGAPLTVSDSIVSNNFFGIAAASAAVFVRNTLAIYNATAGLNSDRATVSVTGSRVDTPRAINGGTITSFGTNQWTNGGPTVTVPLSYLLDDKGGHLLDDRGEPIIAG